MGNYSVSVRKVASLKIADRQTSKTYHTLYPKKNTSAISESKRIFLPELRGELLSGKVFHAEENTPASNVKVALSVPGENYFFKSANTNQAGEYYFNLDRSYENIEATVEVLDEDRKKYKIKATEPRSLDLTDMVFHDFKITDKAKDIILKHSIHNQIENAYLSVKSDSSLLSKPLAPFFHYRAQEYLLDDYTRFKTIKETMIEVVEHVWTTQSKGKHTFHVRPYEHFVSSAILPLVLVDGLIVQDHSDIVDYDARKVHKVSVIRDKYVYGSQIFEGIVSIETIKGDFKNSLEEDHIKDLQLFRPLTPKKYYNQQYNGKQNFERIPDYRNQLLWKPNLILNKKETTITFYTSDNNGQYEINIEGFTNEGTPVSIKEFIRVE